MRPVLWRERSWVAESREEFSRHLSRALLTQEEGKGGPEGPCCPGRFLAPCYRRQDAEIG